MTRWMESQSSALQSAIVHVTETVAKGIQTAQTPLPPPEIQRPLPSRDQLTSMMGDVVTKYDFTDPTDGDPWLGGQPRDSVAMIDPNDDEPYGIPGMKATPLDLSQFPPPTVGAQ